MIKDKEKIVYNSISRHRYNSLPSHVSDEMLIKENVHRIIENLPLDKLTELFKVDIINPKKELRNPSLHLISEERYSKLMELRNNHEIEFNVSIKI